MSNPQQTISPDSSQQDNVSNSDIIAIVALIISITSFVVAIAQALQQYLASAEGYRKCAKAIMGRWAEGTKRRFRWNEVRFEVLYEVPVIFVANPDNKRGPIDKREIYNVDGSDASYSSTLTMNQSQQRVAEEEATKETRFKRVHTTDDERATWVGLLSSLQAAERESRKWDESHGMTPKGHKYQQPDYRLVVQLQRRKRSWDYMPESVLKPYAQTTISHLAEIAIMLGMHWRAFDPDTWNLRAEGNGFIMTSSLYQGLGLGVTFSIFGKAQHDENRPIPCSPLKQLIFGSVPTIFEDTLKQSLKFGDDQDLRRTLQTLNCNQDTIEKYFKRRDHVRSVSFETIAMLCQVCRPRGSNFKMLPNPTKDIWNTTLSSPTLASEVFKRTIELASSPQASAHLRQLETWAKQLTPFMQPRPLTDSTTDAQNGYHRHHRLNAPEIPIDIDIREQVHDCIDFCDTYLQTTNLKAGSKSQTIVLAVVGAHLTTVLNQLDDTMSFLSSRECDTEEELIEHYFNEIRGRVASGLTANTPTGEPTATTTTTTTTTPVTEEKKRLREDVWVTLMVRMVCWWVLHDFDPADTMILPPRLQGSRLPVFVI